MGRSPYLIIWTSGAGEAEAGGGDRGGRWPVARGIDHG